MNKRAVCPNCDFILIRCLCNTLRPIDNKTHIIILQHKSETNHALNTVAIMKKSFLNITIFIGEDFTENLELNELIKNFKKSLGLIFPMETSSILNSTQTQKMTHLIFLDGTWKKSLKMYLLSKNLHLLNIYSLKPTKRSQYKIRSTKFEDGLSTLEAAICALECIEASLDIKSLEDSFLQMIKFQIEMMGEDTFRKNYESEE